MKDSLEDPDDALVAVYADALDKAEGSCDGGTREVLADLAIEMRQALYNRVTLLQNGTNP